MKNQEDEIPVKPVEEYLVNGPIPAEDLRFLDLIETYLELGIADTDLDIHFMLEKISTHGAPKWWKGTVSEFEQEFHDRYHRSANKEDDLDTDHIWRAAHAEVEARRLAPLPDDPTQKQIKEYLSHGLKRMEQVVAVEIILDMWVEAKENRNKPNSHPLKGILGKTIKGVIVKRNTTRNYPAMSVHLVFSDDTSYEIYSDLKLNFAGELDKGDMGIVRSYNTLPKGSMENIVDISVDEEL